MKLRETFEGLVSSTEEVPISLGTLRLVQTEVNLPTGRILVGIDEHECRRLLVPLAHPAATPRVDDHSRGILVKETEYQSPSGVRWYVDVACVESELNELFALVAEEMLVAIKDAPAEDHYNSTIRVLNRWRQLLGRRPGNLLSEEKLAGLWAELMLLKRLEEIDPSMALDYWTGPLGGIHDFEFSDLHIECKALLKREGWNVTINGLQQLRTTNIPLKLCVVRLMRASEGSSVPQLVDELAIMGVDRAVLLEQLAKLGYHVAEESRYRQILFQPVEGRLYSVEAGFPAITPEHFKESLHDAITRLSYSVDLVGAEEFLVSEHLETMFGVFDDRKPT